MISINNIKIETGGLAKKKTNVPNRSAKDNPYFNMKFEGPFS